MFIKKGIKIHNDKLEFFLQSDNTNEGTIKIYPLGSQDFSFNFNITKLEAAGLSRALSQFADECFKEEKKLEDLLTKEDVFENKDKIKETLGLLINKIQPQLSKFNKKAKIIFCKDNSGSMGGFERFAAKAFSTWNYGILTKLYAGNVQHTYVSFNTEADVVVDKEEFFSQGESGGTIVSSGLNKVNDIINSTDLSTDIFVFLLSDGDNLTSDNDKVVRILGDIQRKSKLVSYFEINQYNRSSTLMSSLRHEHAPNFTKHIYRNSDDMLPILDKLWNQVD